MVSHIEGERLLIAGTVDAVETGQEFERLPLHMSLVVWFSFPERHRHYLFEAMDTILTEKDYFQHLVGGSHTRLGDEKQFPARLLRGAEKETGPSYGLRYLINSLGAFRPDDVYANSFRPHVSDLPAQKGEDGKTVVPFQGVAKGQELALPTVALFSAHSEERVQRVLAAYSLGKPIDG